MTGSSKSGNLRKMLALLELKSDDDRVTELLREARQLLEGDDDGR